MTVTAMNEQWVISRKPSLIAADVSDETILMDVDTGYFFQLNITASRIWSLLEAPRSLGDLYERLAELFPSDVDIIRIQAADFIRDLKDRGLFLVSEA